MPKDTPTSFFADAAAIANPAYLLREVSWEEARRTAHEKTQVRGVSFGGMGAEPYRAPSQAELVARAVAAEAKQADYNASRLARARATANEAEQAILQAFDQLRAFRAALSRDDGEVTETAANRAIEAATSGETAAALLNSLHAQVKLMRLPLTNTQPERTA